MPTTVRALLSLPELERGAPHVVAGHDGLDRDVRWVHVSELPDIGGLLKGREVILCTGVALPTSAAERTGYVEQLVAADVSGLVIELGRAYAELPAELRVAADRLALPLVTLSREIRFVQVVEELHSSVVEEQLRELKDLERIHRLFTSLEVKGAAPTQVLRHIADLTARPVVLENLAHQVLSYATVDMQPDKLLADWQQRSRLCGSVPQTTTTLVDDERWLISAVGSRGEFWGRLIVLYETDEQPSQRDISVVERAASMLALNRLVERDRETLELQSHRTLLRKIMDEEYSSKAQIYARAEAMGVPLRGRRLVTVALQASPAPAGDDPIAIQRLRRELGERIATAARQTGISALVSPLGAGAVGALITLDSEQSEQDVLHRLVTQIHRLTFQASPDQDVTIGVGTAVTDVRQVRRSFAEAMQVVNAASAAPEDKLYFRLADVRIRGLIHLLRDDTRLQVFVERELGPLLAQETKQRSADLLSTLTAYLENGYNKSAAADRLGISRPAMYHRLEQISGLLDVDIEAPESQVSLHVAVLGLECLDANRPDLALNGEGPKVGRQWMHTRPVEAS